MQCPVVACETGMGWGTQGQREEEARTQTRGRAGTQRPTDREPPPCNSSRIGWHTASTEGYSQSPYFREVFDKCYGADEQNPGPLNYWEVLPTLNTVRPLSSLALGSADSRATAGGTPLASLVLMCSFSVRDN